MGVLNRFEDDSELSAPKRLAKMLISITAGFVATQLAESVFDRYFVKNSEAEED